MRWLGFRFVQIINDEEQEKCQTSSELFEVLNDQFKTQHN